MQSCWLNGQDTRVERVMETVIGMFQNLLVVTTPKTLIYRHMYMKLQSKVLKLHLPCKRMVKACPMHLSDHVYAI